MSDHPTPADPLADPLDDPPFCQRVIGYLDGEPSPDDLRTLNAELRAEPPKRDAFVHLCLVRVALIRQGAADRAQHPPPPGPPQGTVGRRGDPARAPRVRPPRRPGGGRAPGGVARNPAARDRPPRGRWWSLGAGVAAAVAIGLVWVGAPGTPAAPGRRGGRKAGRGPADGAPAAGGAHGTAAAVTESHDPLTPGTPLTNGQSIQLTAGAAELTFDGGATVLVRAPARVRVVDRRELSVVAGSVYAHVPPAARGFRVTAPGLGVIDRGTNFGVRVGGAGAGRGRGPRLRRPDRGHRPGRPRPAHAPALNVVAGHAVAHRRGCRPRPGVGPRSPPPPSPAA